MQSILTDIHQQRRGRIPKRRRKPPLRQDDRRLKRGRERVHVLPGLDSAGEEKQRKTAKAVKSSEKQRKAGVDVTCQFGGHPVQTRGVPQSLRRLLLASIRENEAGKIDVRTTRELLYKKRLPCQTCSLAQRMTRRKPAVLRLCNLAASAV